MRVLLDECLPQSLKADLPGHDAKTVPEMDWAGTENGELLRLAEQQFDAFITVDRNLPRQLDLSNLRIAVIVLSAPTNRRVDLQPLMPRVGAALESVRPGQVVRIPQA